MSRAFVRESDGDDREDLPERPVSPHPNFVTPRGLQRIDAQVRELEVARAAARQGDDKSAVARIDRDLRYWLQRRATAQQIDPSDATDEVRFGTRVTLRYDDGTERCFTLVGEDEADPGAGLISWLAPVAQALLGRELGDDVSLQGRSAEIAAIEPAPS